MEGDNRTPGVKKQTKRMKRWRQNRSEGGSEEGRINALSVGGEGEIMTRLGKAQQHTSVTQRRSGRVFHLRRINDVRGNGSKQHQSLELLSYGYSHSPPGILRPHCSLFLPPLSVCLHSQSSPLCPFSTP